MTTRHYLLHQLCIACHHYVFSLQLLITLQLSFLNICLLLDITAQFLCISCLRCDIFVSQLLIWWHLSFFASAGNFAIYCLLYLLFILWHFCPSSDGRRISETFLPFNSMSSLWLFLVSVVLPHDVTQASASAVYGVTSLYPSCLSGDISPFLHQLATSRFTAFYIFYSSCDVTVPFLSAIGWSEDLRDFSAF